MQAAAILINTIVLFVNLCFLGFNRFCESVLIFPIAYSRYRVCVSLSNTWGEVGKMCCSKCATKDGKPFILIAAFAARKTFRNTFCPLLNKTRFDKTRKINAKNVVTILVFFVGD